MTEVAIRAETAEGDPLVATFLPEKGMNMISFRRGETEIIDPSTKNLFEERYAGLGALIGPHFHRRNPATISPVPKEEAFPHIARVRANGVVEPFSHGIARYAPWTVDASEDRLVGVLKGDDEWNGVPLKELEGQDFRINLDARLSETGLRLKLDVQSEIDSLMGIHYYYRLPPGDAVVESVVQPSYCDQGEFKVVPEEWGYDGNRQLRFSLDREADYGFRPEGDRLAAEIHLKTSEYTLRTRYRCRNEENSWQLFHPEGASYVCIEPMSAANPRRPQLSVSGLEIELAILDKEGAER